MKELIYLEQLIRYRLNKYFPSGNEEPEPVMPTLDQWHYPLADFIRRHKLNTHEATLLLVALAPHVKPDLFDGVIESKLNDSGNFPKIGGIRGKNARTFLPTGETLLFAFGRPVTTTLTGTTAIRIAASVCKEKNTMAGRVACRRTRHERPHNYVARLHRYLFVR